MTTSTNCLNAPTAHQTQVQAEPRPYWLARLNTLWRNWRETRAMLDMNDSQLADIGLTRDDVRHALRQPLTRDPSHELARARRRYG
jgi:uncharacterized protein YjiS (DUF1127 family)